MPLADRSHTALLQRRKGQTLASFHAAFPTAREQGPGQTTPESTYLARQLGTLTYLVQPGSPPLVENGCCGGGNALVFRLSCSGQTSGSIPDGTTSVVFVNEDGVDRTLTITWDPKGSATYTLNPGSQTITLNPGLTGLSFQLECAGPPTIELTLTCGNLDTPGPYSSGSYQLILHTDPSGDPLVDFDVLDSADNTLLRPRIYATAGSTITTTLSITDSFSLRIFQSCFTGGVASPLDTITLTEGGLCPSGNIVGYVKQVQLFTNPTTDKIFRLHSTSPPLFTTWAVLPGTSFYDDTTLGANNGDLIFVECSTSYP